MTPRTRLLLMIVAAAGLWMARERFAGDDLAVPARTAAERGASPRAATGGRLDPQAEVCVTPPQMPQRGPFASLADVDPFTARPRELPVAKPVTPPVPVATVAVAPPPPPPAPPPAPALVAPYRFLGSLDTQGDGPVSVFLAHGNNVLVAKTGDLLEGGFRLESISPRELVFLHVQQQQTVRLALGGTPP